MSDHDLTLALEARLVNAWPAFEVELVEGWLLRFAEGYSKRANSATPIVPGARLDSALVAHILGSFAARGVDPCFRLVGVEDWDAERVLAESGLVDYDPSVCMVADVGGAVERDSSVRITPVAKPGWVTDAARAYGGNKSDAAKLGRIVGSIRQPSAFASLEVDGRDVAWGLAVAERGFVGLYDLVVSPDLRSLGLGRRLVTTLMAWGREAGAARAYLQMRVTNTVASALYASLGFAPSYRYTHRVRPNRNRPPSAPTGGSAAVSGPASPADGEDEA